ncbi:hypothetical protein LTR84_007992 [Exophiala bonariae]|uniref:Mannosyl phosphorylinositol ceramide synthase SUR1 n=1 Tax=Exophiala bonariae TaxID=1690606 RepID=A0AAV9NLR6_9EURO|nr:hypothetical protein LTR84_007992 [Exophiala bonariae]
MRRSLVIFLVIAGATLIFLLHAVSTLLALLIEDASGDAIAAAEIPSPNSTLPDTRPRLIPKIIHQTYKNETIPERWKAAQQSCIDLHPDYEYMMWTDAKSEAFIEKEYAWFLPTFTGYKHPIQRADAIRYFVLAHHGGVYIDLDDGCKRRLDPLLSYNAWLRRTVPTGISNDAMGSVPQHPFFLRIIQSLQGADRAWVLPYITIMASTGPLFLSVIWKNWIDEHSHLDQDTWPGRVRVLMPDEYTKHPWSFFNTFKGDSWHGKDAQFIFWMGKNWLLLVVVGTAVGLTLIFLVWSLYSRVLSLSASRRRGGSPRSSPRVGAYRFPGASRVPLWMRWGGGLKKKYSYELVEQHDA